MTDESLILFGIIAIAMILVVGTVGVVLAVNDIQEKENGDD